MEVKSHTTCGTSPTTSTLDTAPGGRIRNKTLSFIVLAVGNVSFPNPVQKVEHADYHSHCFVCGFRSNAGLGFLHHDLSAPGYGPQRAAAASRRGYADAH